MIGYYAFLNDLSVVTELFVVADDAEHIAGKKSEDYYSEIRNQVCKKTCDTGCFRKVMAEVGGTYDGDADAFIPRRLFSSWTFNRNVWLWEAPTPYPDDGLEYRWEESTLSWVIKDDNN